MKNILNKISQFFKRITNPYKSYKKAKVNFEHLMHSKKHIEDEIKRNEERIFDSFVTKKKFKEDGPNIFIALFRRNELLMEQLNIIKDVQSDVNSTYTITIGDVAKKVYHYIYEVMNMSRRKEFLDNIKKQLGKLKVKPEEFVEPNQEYKMLENKLSEYNKLLSEFNKNTVVSVPLVPNLTLEYLK